MTISAQYETGAGVFSLADTPTSGNAYPATDPSFLGARPVAAYLQADTQNVRFTADGSNPTASVGILLTAGDPPFFYNAGPLTQLKFIRTTAGAKLNVTYSAEMVAGGVNGAQGSQGAQGSAGAQGAQGAAGGYGSDTQGTAGALTVFKKSLTGMANATFVTICTVTVPVGNNAATILIDGFGMSGAGGAVGAGEAMRATTARLTTQVNRAAGVAMAYNSAGSATAATTVVDGVAITMTFSTNTVNEEILETNSFEIQARVSRASGTADNHTALFVVTVLNQNASGVTVA